MEPRKGDIIRPHIRAWKEGFRDIVNITILKEIVGIRTCFVKELHFVEEEDEAVLSSVAMQLNATYAQKLMDDLWDCGVRPSEGSGSVGSLKATQVHLQDMRKIAFDRLKIKNE